MSKKSKNNQKILDDIKRLELEILSAITKKSNGTKEINIQGHRDKISKLKAQLA